MPPVMRTSGIPSGTPSPTPQRRRHEDEALHPHTNQSGECDRAKTVRRCLDPSAQEHHERHDERQADREPREGRPLSTHTAGDESGLFGQIGIPDHQILRPEHVRPQDTETEEQLADVVQLTGTDVVVQPQPVAAQDGHQREERDADEQDSLDFRVPWQHDVVTPRTASDRWESRHRSAPRIRMTELTIQSDVGHMQTMTEDDRL